MPDCGVHYLWFAFVCFLIRSPPPLNAPPKGTSINKAGNAKDMASDTGYNTATNYPLYPRNPQTL